MQSLANFAEIRFLSAIVPDWSGGELDIASCRYGQLEIAILHGDLEQIANWVEAPRSSQVNIHGAKAEIPSCKFRWQISMP
jgi:hypothetical protein